MTSFWSWYIIAIVLLTLVGCAALLVWTKKMPIKDAEDNKELSHSFDGIKELNTPLPRWWMGLFWGTLIFCFIYLAFYPGFGNFAGFNNWTSAEQHAKEKAELDQKYTPIYQQYASMPLPDVAKDPKAIKIGQRLFIHNCSACHGSDARGAIGYPNLTDSNWIYGGSPEEIIETITNGREALMPPAQSMLGGETAISEVLNYVLMLNSRQHDKAKAEKGKKHFKEICATCHGEDAKGNKELGAPNLTINKWTYGGAPFRIENSIRNGRHGIMPAHKDILTKEKIHLVSAYVYSLSHPEN